MSGKGRVRYPRACQMEVWKVLVVALPLAFVLLICGAEEGGYWSGHDGRTVDAMLRSIGEGSACKEGGACELQSEEMCWGYEKDCDKHRRLFIPRCHGSPKPWADSLEGKCEHFWYQGDFGYCKEVVDSMATLCQPQQEGDSLLECSENLRYCHANNLFIDFRRFREMSKSQGKYVSFLEDIFHLGEIGGHCKFDKEQLVKNGEHKSPLQSWYAELEQFTSLDFSPTTTEHCDEIVTTPTYFIKLDAGINMYHHFCDFFNLFASQHINGSFSDDVFIVMWDTSYRTYMDFFADTWSAFTRHPVQRLSDFDGKRMCFKEAVFPLLARMRKGLFYNSYLLPECYGSGLMQAFSKHLLSRLSVEQQRSPPGKVRVTLLSRSTKHRRIVNQDELVSAMKTVGFFEVRVVDYKARVFPFLEQLKASHNSDIFMGMHGSGLTHLLFLPDWAGVFEIYNTEDPRCYYDLARLRGVQYITWENDRKWEKEAEGLHPSLGTAHAKFTNYSFDVAEFMRLVTSLGDQVRERKMAALSHQIFLTET